jgi:hypothetical protein
MKVQDAEYKALLDQFNVLIEKVKADVPKPTEEDLSPVFNVLPVLGERNGPLAIEYLKDYFTSGVKPNVIAHLGIKAGYHANNDGAREYVKRACELVSAAYEKAMKNVA